MPAAGPAVRHQVRQRDGSVAAVDVQDLVDHGVRGHGVADEARHAVAWRQRLRLQIGRQLIGQPRHVGRLVQVPVRGSQDHVPWIGIEGLVVRSREGHREPDVSLSVRGRSVRVVARERIAELLDEHRAPRHAIGIDIGDLRADGSLRVCGHGRPDEQTRHQKQAQGDMTNLTTHR